MAKKYTSAEVRELDFMDLDDLARELSVSIDGSAVEEAEAVIEALKAEGRLVESDKAEDLSGDNHDKDEEADEDAEDEEDLEDDEEDEDEDDEEVEDEDEEEVDEDEEEEDEDLEEDADDIPDEGGEGKDEPAANLCAGGQVGVKVVYPPYDQSYPGFVGKTVGDVFRELSRLWSIPSGASVVVNGRNANHSTFLNDGDDVEFIRPAAEKGKEIK